MKQKRAWISIEFSFHFYLCDKQFRRIISIINVASSFSLDANFGSIRDCFTGDNIEIQSGRQIMALHLIQCNEELATCTNTQASVLLAYLQKKTFSAFNLAMPWIANCIGIFWFDSNAAENAKWWIRLKTISVFRSFQRKDTVLRPPSRKNLSVEYAVFTSVWSPCVCAFYHRHGYYYPNKLAPKQRLST